MFYFDDDGRGQGRWRRFFTIILQFQVKFSGLAVICDSLPSTSDKWHKPAPIVINAIVASFVLGNITHLRSIWLISNGTHFEFNMRIKKFGKQNERNTYEMQIVLHLYVHDIILDESRIPRNAGYWRNIV